MTNPKHGDESTCRFCGETIRLIGRIWKHWPGPRRDDLDGYPHIALPVADPVPTKRQKRKVRKDGKR